MPNAWVSGEISPTVASGRDLCLDLSKDYTQQCNVYFDTGQRRLKGGSMKGVRARCQVLAWGLFKVAASL
jgi:hypothetical protein